MPDQDSARQLRPILHYVPPFSTLVVSPTASPRLGDIVYVYGSATVYCSPPPPPTAPPAWRALPSSAGPLTPPPTFRYPHARLRCPKRRAVAEGAPWRSDLDAFGWARTRRRKRRLRARGEAPR